MSNSQLDPEADKDPDLQPDSAPDVSAVSTPSAPAAPTPPAAQDPRTDMTGLIDQTQDAAAGVQNETTSLGDSVIGAGETQPVETQLRANTDAKSERINNRLAYREQAEQFGALSDQLGAASAEKSAWDNLDLLTKHAQAQQEAARQMEQELQQQAFRYREAVDNFKQYNPNPWTDRGIGFEIGAAISIGVAGFGAALMGSTNNPATQIINDALHRDLQKAQLQYEQLGANVQHEHTMYNVMRDIYQDKQAAMHASLAAGKELVAARAQAQLMAIAPEQRTLQAQKLIAQFHADAQEEAAKAGDTAFTQRVTIEKLKAQKLAQQMLMERRQQQTSPNMFEEEGLKGTSAKELNDLFSSYTGPFQSYSRDVYETLQMPTEEILKPENFTRLQTGLAGLSQESRKLKGQGVRFNKQLQEIDELLSSGSKGGAGAKTLKDALTNGSVLDSFVRANQEQSAEFKNRIGTVSGKPFEYWFDKQLNKLKSYNSQKRYENGIGSEDDDGR